MGSEKRASNSGSLRSEMQNLVQVGKRLAGLAENQCALCLQKNMDLRISHLVPSFVTGWLKETSGTGFMRGGVVPEARMQDGLKGPLLCITCETLFSRDEREFANKVFYPYVKKELDDRGVGQGIVRSVKYEEWLLRFVISVQWRCSFLYLDCSSGAPPSAVEQAHRIIDEWRPFLLRRRENSGFERHYIIPLQSLAGVRNPEIFRDFPRNSNLYALRAVDCTAVFRKGYLGFYVKLGPVVLWTSVKPVEVANLGNLRIKKRGLLPLVASLYVPEISSFIYRDRPKKFLEESPIPEITKKRVERSIHRDPEKFARSMTRAATKADMLVQYWQMLNDES